MRDRARSTSFYEALGWVRSSASVDGNVSFFQMGGSALGLFGVDEVHAVFGAWIAVGATAVKQPELVFWGGYSSDVADPDGHLWELAHSPGFALLADGSMRLPD